MGHYQQFIVTPAPIEVEIDLAGEKHKAYIKEIGVDAWVALIRAEAPLSRQIAAVVCDPDGTLALTEEEASMLKPHVATQFSAHITEIYLRGKPKT